MNYNSTYLQQKIMEKVIDLEQGLYVTENGSEFISAKLAVAVSSVGVALSAISLLLLISTAILFSEWRRSYKNQLLIQLMISRFYYIAVRYSYDIRSFYDLPAIVENAIYFNKTIFIHSEVTLISWMFVFSMQMYRSLVKVFNSTKPCLWKVSSLTWGVSLLVSVIAINVYKVKVKSNLLFLFTYIAVCKWPFLIANATVLIMILRSLRKSNIQKVQVQRSKARLVIVMNMLIWTFCFQQVIVDIYKLLMILRILPLSFLRIINIGLIFTCFFTTTFWLFGNSKTREMWKDKICCQVDRESET